MRTSPSRSVESSVRRDGCGWLQRRAEEVEAVNAPTIRRSQSRKWLNVCLWHIADWACRTSAIERKADAARIRVSVDVKANGPLT
jgi:hypothetical protein